MGKWSFLKNDPRFKTVDTDNPDYQAKVLARRDELLRELADIPKSDLHRAAVLRYNEAKEDKDRLEEQVSLTNLEIAAIEALILERMEAMGLDNFRSDGYTYTDYVEPTAKAVDKRALVAWVKKNDMEEMLSLHSQTLNALVKEQLGPGGGNKIPDGVELGMRRQLRRTKAGR